MRPLRQLGYAGCAALAANDEGRPAPRRPAGSHTTIYAYDRNRLLSATSVGATAAYNHDPFGRLDTVTVAGR